MKSLDDHIKSYVFNIGKYKDMPLTEVIDLDWLDWFVKSDYSNKWQKKLVNKYIDDIAKDIQDKMDKEKTEQKNENDLLQDELKKGMWVNDDNF